MLGIERGYLRFSVEFFCLTVPESFVGKHFSVSFFGYRKSLWIRREEYHDFPSEVFCLTVPKIFVGKPFTEANFLGIEKVWIREGGRGGEGVSRFSVKKFLSGSAEKFCRGILQCFINFRYRKLLGIKDGGFMFFRRTFFVSQFRKNW